MSISALNKEPRRVGIFLIVLFLIGAVMLTAPAVPSAEVAVGISVTFAPPALPVYAQPLCPGPGFIWIPGYWAWDPEFGYYWVPGMWVRAPFIGALWTPGYWAWSEGVFIWNEGYWGPEVGFYGGIDYGFGYTGVGYDGGYWRNGAFFYNRTVNNINITNITTVYSKSVARVRPAGASFNGGRGGVVSRPTSAQLAAAGHRRLALTDSQKTQMSAARASPKQRATVNRGRPVIAATPKAGVFKGRGVLSASRAGAPYKSPPAGKAAAGKPARSSKPGTEARKSLKAPEGKKAGAPGKPRESRIREQRAKPRETEPTKQVSKEKTKSEPKANKRVTKPEQKKAGTPRQETKPRASERRAEPHKPEPVRPAQKEKTKGETKIDKQVTKPQQKKAE